MKFAVAALLAALTTACFAQSIDIGSPLNETSVTPGSSIVVQVNQPDSPTTLIEVGIVIGIQSCSTAACPTPGSELGSILFNGPFNPQPTPISGPFQNFTVTIPSTIAQAPAQLSVFVVALVGAEAEPFTETQTIVLNVV